VPVLSPKPSRRISAACRVGWNSFKALDRLIAFGPRILHIGQSTFITRGDGVFGLVPTGSSINLRLRGHRRGRAAASTASDAVQEEPATPARLTPRGRRPKLSRPNKATHQAEWRNAAAPGRECSAVDQKPGDRVQPACRARFGMIPPARSFHTDRAGKPRRGMAAMIYPTAECLVVLELVQKPDVQTPPSHSRS